MNNFKKAGRKIKDKLPANIRTDVLNSVGKLSFKLKLDDLVDLENIVSLKLNNIEGIKVFEFKDFIKKISQSEKPFKTSLYSLFICEKKEGFINVEHQNIIIKEKQILCIAPHKIIQFNNPDKLKGKLIFFSKIVFAGDPIKLQFLFDSSLFERTGNSKNIFLNKRYEDVFCLSEMIIRELKEIYNHTQKQLIANYLFSILLIGAEILNKSNSDLGHKATFNLMNRLKKSVFMQDNKNRSIKYYATALNISVTTLNKAFKQYENTTPKRWLTNLILKEIKQELVAGTSSIGEIAVKYGFEDVTNFTKYFKKHIGITPTNYKKQFKEI